MRQTKGTTSTDAVLLNRTEFYARMGCGRQTADQIAKEAGAERRFGRRVLVYFPAVQAYLASGNGQNTERK